MGEVMGLVQTLGKDPESIFALTQRLKRDFSTFLSVIKAAELIGLVETPGQAVRLTPKGTEFRQADPKHRKTLMYDLLLELKIFHHFADRIDHSEEKQITEQEVLDDLAQLFPGERPKILFKTMMAGRATPSSSPMTSAWLCSSASPRVTSASRPPRGLKPVES